MGKAPEEVALVDRYVNNHGKAKISKKHCKRCGNTSTNERWCPCQSGEVVKPCDLVPGEYCVFIVGGQSAMTGTPPELYCESSGKNSNEETLAACDAYIAACGRTRRVPPDQQLQNTGPAVGLTDNDDEAGGIIEDNVSEVVQQPDGYAAEQQTVTGLDGKTESQQQERDNSLQASDEDFEDMFKHKTEVLRVGDWIRHPGRRPGLSVTNDRYKRKCQ